MTALGSACTLRGLFRRPVCSKSPGIKGIHSVQGPFTHDQSNQTPIRGSTTLWTIWEQPMSILNVRSSAADQLQAGLTTVVFAGLLILACPPSRYSLAVPCSLRSAL